MLQHCLSIKMALNWCVQTAIKDVAILYWQVLWWITRSKFLSQALKQTYNAQFAMFHQKKEN